MSLPDSMAFLLGISLHQATLIFDTTGGKFSVSEMSVDVVSSTSLEIWDGLKLDHLSLFFAYSKTQGKEIIFAARLTFGDDDSLDFSIEYNGPQRSAAPSKALAPPSQSLAASVDNQSSWCARASYDGTISVLNILKRVSGIDIRQELTSAGLSVLRDVVDINVTDLKIELSRSSSATSFLFDAGTDWLFFSHLRFACSKSQAWSYSFAFTVAPNIDLFSKVGLDIGLSFTDMSVVVFNNMLDMEALPVASRSIMLPDPTPGVKVLFAGRLNLEHDKLKVLQQVICLNSLSICGLIGDGLVSLSAATDAYSLFDGRMQMAGAVVVEYRNNAFKVGIQGTPQFLIFHQRSNALLSSYSQSDIGFRPAYF